ncbi:MAG: polyisoprenoid-binding protein [Calditrichae bacterium]|nr:polyisoprenoid-binding protein [Calditrichota bacterium]MCB9058014.1 polyisoprenoid-binding protein [Calditrichia bacterium]
MSKLLFIFTVFILAAGSAFASNWTIDKSHSKVGFEVDHMIITTVDGNFGDYDVKLTFDPNDLSTFSVEAVVKISSVNTENEKRDEHLRSADFFDAASFPEMVFKSNQLVKNGDSYIAKGTLTIRGVTKEVNLPFSIKGPVKDPWGNTRIGVDAGAEINRQDFGVKWSKSMDGGGLVVSDEVQINISAEFIQQ